MIRVRRVVTRRDRTEFIRLPFSLYAGDPNWVAPLRTDTRARINRDKSPFFRHAEAALFLAERDGRVVGRVSAQVDRHYNDLHPPGRTGFFGFFECEDDTDAADALLDSAGAWLAGHGCDDMIGPASFTLNDEAGLLVDGFGSPPMVMMAYNPPYYERLIEKAGFVKAQDLWAYRLDASAPVPGDVRAFARSAERDGFRFRTIDMHRYDEEARRFLGVYNRAWEHNWGFAPMTDEEILGLAKTLKPVIDPRLVFVAEHGDEIAGVGLTLPNVNEVLIRLRGRLLPFGAARLLWAGKRRQWTSCRVVALGVTRERRHSGIGAHLYIDTLEAARGAGYQWGEMSWILESNDAMNSGIRHMGGTLYKTYRMFTRPTR